MCSGLYIFDCLFVFLLSPISTILAKTSDIKLLNVEKAITFDVGNPDPSLKHVPKRSGVKPVDEISTPS
jgi:hypothetical protein